MSYPDKRCFDRRNLFPFIDAKPQLELQKQTPHLKPMLIRSVIMMITAPQPQPRLFVCCEGTST